MMSKLKISDLSFYETDFEHSAQVRGGMSPRFSPLRRFSGSFFSDEQFEMGMTEGGVGDDSRIQFILDEKRGSYGVVLSQETDNGSAMSGIFQDNAIDAKRRRTFAMSSIRR